MVYFSIFIVAGIARQISRSVQESWQSLPLNRYLPAAFTR